MSKMSNEEFFKQQRANSAMKTEVVSAYFEAWSNVMTSAQNDVVQYFDLLCGPGRYEDGTPSTPLKIVEIAARHPILRSKLRIVFSDQDEEMLKRLKKELHELPATHDLRYKPLVMKGDAVNVDSRILSASQRHPTFSFVDPFGYRALSREVISGLLKGWGNDVVLFFNYSDVNRAISNSVMTGNMTDLFGQERSLNLRGELDGLLPHQRKQIIVDGMVDALTERVKALGLPFGFTVAGTQRESHHLIFLSKHIRGYEIMRDVMLKRNNRTGEDLRSLGYSDINEDTPFLFEFSQQLSNLPSRLLEKYSGGVWTRDELYEADLVGTVYKKKDYNAALKALEEADQLTIVASKPKRRKGQYKDVTFRIAG